MTPKTKSMVNQINIIGPKNLPMDAVPNCCIKKNRARIVNTIITTVLLPSSIHSVGIFFNPSIAEVIDIGGVIIPSASKAAPPTIAGITSHFFLRRTSA